MSEETDELPVAVLGQCCHTRSKLEESIDGFILGSIDWHDAALCSELTINIVVNRVVTPSTSPLRLVVMSIVDGQAAPEKLTLTF